MHKEIVIIGLGFAGLASYRTLLSNKDFKNKCKLTIIDKKDYFEFTPSILNAFFSPNSHKGLTISYSRIKQNTAFIQGKLIKLSINSCEILKKDLSKEIISFDHCILAFGSQYPFYIRPVEDLTLEERFQTMIKQSHLLENSKNILIIGSGPTAIEMAAFLMNYGKKNKNNVKKVRVFVRGKQILKGFPAKSAIMANKILQKKGVSFIFEGDFNKIDEKSYDLVIQCTGNQFQTPQLINNEIFEEFIHKGSNKLIVNDFLQLQSLKDPSKTIKNIYAVGDIFLRYECSLINYSEQDVCLKAEISGEIAAENIIRTIKNETTKRNSKQLKKMGKVFDSYVIDLGSKRDCILVFKNIVIVGILAWLMKKFIEKTSMRKMENYKIFVWLWVIIHLFLGILKRIISFL